MDKMKDFNLKKVLITLGELAILTIVCVFLYSNIFVWFKSTSYIGSTLTWIVIALILSLYGIFFSIKNISNNCKIFTLLSTSFYILAGIVFLTMIVIGIKNSSIITSKDRYAKVNESVEVINGDESSDAFPNLLGKNNDTTNLPLIGVPEAIKLCETEMGKKPSLSSQFEIKEESVTSQSINGELCYVVPIEPIAFWKWDKNVGNYGYFVVDRNNKKTTFVETSLMTTEYAPFNSSASRIIYAFMKRENIKGLITDISPEVDDEGNFHYIATVYTKKLGGMKKVKGVVDLNAIDKTCKFYKVDEIPEFVDRVYPEEFFEDYVKYYGSYSRGFWNSIFAQKDVQVLTNGMDVIYIDGICYYYSGLMSTKNENSTSAIIMMNSRTGEITIYNTSGISEKRAMELAEGKVQEKEYTASYPLLLKVGNEETYFLLMRDKNENLVGYAFVNYHDASFVSVNENLLLAQNEYIKACSISNNANSLENETLSNENGIISAITSEVLDGTTIYYIRLEGSNQIYSVHSSVYPEIVFTQVGDSLNISYVNSESTIIPIVEIN